MIVLLHLRLLVVVGLRWPFCATERKLRGRFSARDDFIYKPRVQNDQLLLLRRTFQLAAAQGTLRERPVDARRADDEDLLTLL